jgi:hypothetical protein
VEAAWVGAVVIEAEVALFEAEEKSTSDYREFEGSSGRRRS